MKISIFIIVCMLIQFFGGCATGRKVETLPEASILSENIDKKLQEKEEKEILRKMEKEREKAERDRIKEEEKLEKEKLKQMQKEEKRRKKEEEKLAKKAEKEFIKEEEKRKKEEEKLQKQRLKEQKIEEEKRRKEEEKIAREREKEILKEQKRVDIEKKAKRTETVPSVSQGPTDSEIAEQRMLGFLAFMKRLQEQSPKPKPGEYREPEKVERSKGCMFVVDLILNVALLVAFLQLPNFVK